MPQLAVNETLAVPALPHPLAFWSYIGVVLVVALHFAEPKAAGPQPLEEYHSVLQISPVCRLLDKPLAAEEEEAPQLAQERQAALVASPQQQPSEPEAQLKSQQL